MGHFRSLIRIFEPCKAFVICSKSVYYFACMHHFGALVYLRYSLLARALFVYITVNIINICIYIYVTYKYIKSVGYWKIVYFKRNFQRNIFSFKPLHTDLLHYFTHNAHAIVTATLVLLFLLRFRFVAAIRLSTFDR